MKTNIILILTIVFSISIISISVFSKNPEKSQYKDNGDGTVSDIKSGLVWQKCSLGQKGKNCGGEAGMFTQNDAMKACSKLKLAGKKWRLPKIDELRSLTYCSDGTDPQKLMKHNEKGDPYMCGWSGGNNYDKKYQLPVIHSDIFPNTVPDGYWSSSVDGRKGLSINFGNGPMNDYGQSFEFFVRCVAEWYSKGS
ncbi:MAG: DUF1566 domain-containing protein [Spirochaetia bacterium]|nr:DUF1566 domain-containing protein [Spirochaetia bacterium]